MNDKMEVTIKNVEKNINDKLEIRLNSIDAGINDLKKDVVQNDKKVDDFNKALKIRMDKIEEDLRRSKHRRMSSDTLGSLNKQKLTEETDSSEDKATEHVMVRENSWANEVEQEYKKKEEDDKKKEIKRREEERRTRDKQQWIDQRRIPNDWTAGLRAEVRPHDRCVEKTVKGVETISRIDGKVKKAVRHWFGDDSDSEEDSAKEDDDHDEWNVVDRQKKNEIKKRRLNAKKMKKKEEVLEKVNHMVGISPIENEIIEYHMEKKHGDYEMAKIAAIKEHLSRFYKYNTSELDAVKIVETKFNKKVDGDNILYFATEDKQDIVDLYVRKAECKRDDVSLRNFIPPQIFNRFTAINKICKMKREENNKLKTQIRFGKSDLEILTKLRGSEESFKVINLNDFIGDADIPEFDFDVKWKCHRDRAPRRRVSSSRSTSPAPPVTRNSMEELPSRVIRQLSINSDDGVDSKRRKGQESMDSCHINDLKEAMIVSENDVEKIADETL